jgi:hypothetical protein
MAVWMNRTVLARCLVRKPIREDLEPALVGLFDADGLACEHLAQIDLSPIEADATARCDRDRSDVADAIRHASSANDLLLQESGLDSADRQSAE